MKMKELGSSSMWMLQRNPKDKQGMIDSHACIGEEPHEKEGTRKQLHVNAGEEPQGQAGND